MSPMHAPVEPSVSRWQSCALVLWPSFLMAGVLEAIVFTFVDSDCLHAVSAGLHDSTTAVYSLAFLVFWSVISAAGFMTQFLRVPPGNTRAWR